MDVKIKRALISVSDKNGVVEFAKELTWMGVTIISTGGTAKALADAGIDVVSVDSVTGFPVEAEKRYEYQIEQGPVESSGQSDGGERLVHGRTLLALRDGDAMDRRTLLEAKNLMRRILAFYLGDKPLKSRELFAGFHQNRT